jgi:hypothetical protein
VAGRKESRWREPSEDERILLSLAVRVLPEAVRGAYERQLEGISVRFDCDCGCPSLEVRTGEDAPAAAATLAPHDAGWAFFDDDSGPCELLLFTKEGRLQGLELVCYVDKPRPGACLAKVTEDAAKKVVLYERGADDSG